MLSATNRWQKHVTWAKNKKTKTKNVWKRHWLQHRAFNRLRSPCHLLSVLLLIARAIIADKATSLLRYWTLGCHSCYVPSWKWFRCLFLAVEFRIVLRILCTCSKSLKVTTHRITWKSSKSHSTSPVNLTLLISFPSGASKAVCTKPGRPPESSWSAQTGHPCLPAQQVTNLIQSDLCFVFQRRSKPWWRQGHCHWNNLHLSRCQD